MAVGCATESKPWTRHPISSALVIVALSGMVTGCSFRERVCVRGEAPALQVDDGQLTGGSRCVADGEEPPPSFIRYPPDLEPTYLEDKAEATRAVEERLRATNGQ